MDSKNIMHLVVVRLALKWNHPNLKVSWHDWVKDRLNLYRQITLPSLAAQSDQDFVILSLLHPDAGEMYDQPLLGNEVGVAIGGDGDYPKREVIDYLKASVHNMHNNGVDSVIITRLDSDDMLDTDFIKNVKKHLTEDNTYVDLKQVFHHDLNTGKSYLSYKYKNTVSPFVSVRESTHAFGALVYDVAHNDINKYVNGTKTDDLIATQVVHGNNMVNKIQGKEIMDYPYHRYGGYFQ